ncbi:hypothetical protein ppKF707_5964 [Metapseudomonas furukawaii]|nr:hypothetical protein ppKF707_5698 [Pseudomonas furukawaii]ELS28264.1 hypothetical protein ppKF707_5964 [Pseudomonas furukawaii]
MNKRDLRLACRMEAPPGARPTSAGEGTATHEKSGCGTGPHPLRVNAGSIRTGDRRCPASGR